MWYVGSRQPWWTIEHQGLLVEEMMRQIIKASVLVITTRRRDTNEDGGLSRERIANIVLFINDMGRGPCKFTDRAHL